MPRTRGTGSAGVVGKALRDAIRQWARGPVHVNFNADAESAADGGEFFKAHIAKLGFVTVDKSEGFGLSVPFGEVPSPTAARVEQFDGGKGVHALAVVGVDGGRLAGCEGGLELCQFARAGTDAVLVGVAVGEYFCEGLVNVVHNGLQEVCLGLGAAVIGEGENEASAKAEGFAGGFHGVATGGNVVDKIGLAECQG